MKFVDLQPKEAQEVIARGVFFGTISTALLSFAISAVAWAFLLR